MLSKFPSCSSGSLFTIEDKNDCIFFLNLGRIGTLNTKREAYFKCH